MNRLVARYTEPRYTELRITEHFHFVFELCRFCKLSKMLCNFLPNCILFLCSNVIEMRPNLWTRPLKKVDLYAWLQIKFIENKQDWISPVPRMKVIIMSDKIMSPVMTSVQFWHHSSSKMSPKTDHSWSCNLKNYFPFIGCKQCNLLHFKLHCTIVPILMWQFFVVIFNFF